MQFMRVISHIRLPTLSTYLHFFSRMDVAADCLHLRRAVRPLHDEVILVILGHHHAVTFPGQRACECGRVVTDTV